MHHYYRIMVPSTMYDRAAPVDIVDAIRDEVKAEFARVFGGYTEIQANGGYLAKSGALIEEPVFVIEASYEVEDDELVLRLAKRVKFDLHQEAVMIRKDHEVSFV